MISEYLEAAMQHARYEVFQDDGGYFGEIPVCRGVYAHAPTLERCREMLKEILEEWILVRTYRHLDLPEIDGVKLVVAGEDEAA